MDDKKWQAQDDARTLAEANIIVNDPERLKLAQDEAAKMAKEQQEKARAMTRVAGKKRVRVQDGEGKRGNIPQNSDTNIFNVFKRID